METYDTDKKSENEQIIAEVKTEAPATMFTAWKKYACFKGRASRREYWLFVIPFVIVINLLSWLIDVVPENFSFIFAVPAFLFLVAGLLPWLSVIIRRLHDTGRNWMHLLNYVTLLIVSILLTIIGITSALGSGTGICFAIAGCVLSLAVSISFTVMMSRASEPCENLYGPNPNQGNPDSIAPAIAGILIVYILPLLIKASVNIYNYLQS